ncbi:hypothetical protein ACJX0J_042524, partial [Zea mays]
TILLLLTFFSGQFVLSDHVYAMDAILFVICELIFHWKICLAISSINLIICVDCFHASLCLFSTACCVRDVSTYAFHIHINLIMLALHALPLVFFLVIHQFLDEFGNQWNELHGPEVSLFTEWALNSTRPFRVVGRACVLMQFSLLQYNNILVQNMFQFHVMCHFVLLHHFFMLRGFITDELRIRNLSYLGEITILLLLTFFSGQFVLSDHVYAMDAILFVICELIFHWKICLAISSINLIICVDCFHASLCLFSTACCVRDVSTYAFHIHINLIMLALHALPLVFFLVIHQFLDEFGNQWNELHGPEVSLLHERLQESQGDEVLKAEASAKVHRFTEWALKCIGLHSRVRENRGKGNHDTVIEVQLQLSTFKIFLDLADNELTGKDFTEAFDAACFPLTLFSTTFDQGWASGISAAAVQGLLELLVEGGADNVNQCFLEAARYGSTELVWILLHRIAIAYLLTALCEIWIRGDEDVDYGYDLLKRYRTS